MRRLPPFTMPTIRPLAAAFVTCIALAACESPNAPEPAPSFDAASIAAEYATAARLLEATRSPALAALGAEARARSSVRGVASVFAGALAEPAPFNALRLISPRSRGVTFVYDAETRDWRADPLRVGAPADGVRFVLYETDASGRPIAEREIGYADLIDEGVGSNDDIALRLVVVERGTTRLEYAATVANASEPDRVTLRGTVRDGSESLQFDLALRADTNDGLATTALDLDLQVAPAGASIGASVRGANEVNDDGEVRLSAAHGDVTLDAFLERLENDVQGYVDLDTRRLVVISGRAESPTLRRPTGEPLNGPELLFVAAVADLAAGTFDVAEGLVRPLDNLILLAALL